MKSFLRFLLAFVAGTVCFTLGAFICGGLLYGIGMAIGGEESTISWILLSIGFAAGSVLGPYVFHLVDKGWIHRTIFSALLVILATIYLIACITVEVWAFVILPLGIGAINIAFIVVAWQERGNGTYLGDSLQALKAVKKINAGETAELSKRQIVSLIVNLPAAKRNLFPEQFEQVYLLYLTFRQEKDKQMMDLSDYYKTAVDMIKKFDAIAPYSDYSGADPAETQKMMYFLRGMEGDHE